MITFDNRDSVVSLFLSYTPYGLSLTVPAIYREKTLPAKTGKNYPFIFSSILYIYRYTHLSHFTG